MFREMRRVGKELTTEQAKEILKNNTNGVLSVLGDEGYAYGVPLSYIYEDNKIYFHCATVGHKLEAMQKNPKVSFCIVQQDNIVPKDFTTMFISAIAFGKINIIENKDEKKAILIKIIEKYSGDYMEKGKKYIEEAFDDCLAVEINIDHLTGKAGN